MRNQKVIQDVVIVDYLSMEPLGDTAIMVRFGDVVDVTIHRKVQALSGYLDQQPFPSMIEYVPAFTSIAIYYDVLKASSLMKIFHVE